MIVVLRCGVAVMAAQCRDRAPWWLYENDAERQPRRPARRDRAHNYVAIVLFIIVVQSRHHRATSPQPPPSVAARGACRLSSIAMAAVTSSSAASRARSLSAGRAPGNPMSPWPLRPKFGENRPPSRGRVVPRHVVLVARARGAVRSSAAVISVEKPMTAPCTRGCAARLVEDHADLPPPPPQPPALAAVAARAFVAVTHAEVTAICTQAAIHAQQQQQRHADAPAGGGGATAADDDSRSGGGASRLRRETRDESEDEAAKRAFAGGGSAEKRLRTRSRQSQRD